MQYACKLLTKMVVIYTIKYFNSSFNPYQPPIQMERTTQRKTTTKSIADWYMDMYFSNVHTKPSSSLLNIVLTSFLGSFNDTSRKTDVRGFRLWNVRAKQPNTQWLHLKKKFGCRSESLYGCLVFDGNERLVLGHLF